MAVSINIFCVFFLIDLISAINDTDLLATYSTQVSTTAAHIPSEYNTVYGIRIDYKHDGLMSNIDTRNLHLQSVFTASTIHAFNQFHLTIFNPTYCYISGQQYNSTELCTHYTDTIHLEKHRAYGMFVGKASNHNDAGYSIDAIIHYDPFVAYLAKCITNRTHSESFSIIAVNVSVVDTMEYIPTQDSMVKQTLLLLILNHILSIELYVLLALCLLFASLIFTSKVFGLYTNRDDIEFVYGLYFIVFALNFYANCMMFTLRLFEQQRFILGTSAIFFFVVIRIKYNLSVAVTSKAIWTKSAFINKRVNEWFSRYQHVFIALALISEPVGAVTFVNSRLFIHNIFLMNLPQSMMVGFIGDLFWNIFWIQRVPELAIQIVFVAMNGYDHYTLCAHLTTIACIVLLSIMKVRTWRQHKDFLVQRSAFLMEISSEEINKNVMKYLVRPTIFREVIADILEINKNSIELLSFEAINVSTELNFNNNKVFRCYGLKTYIALRSNSMLRRYALMKLEKAKENETLTNKLRDAWDLEQVPSIDDIVMVYDLSGDLVIQRAHSWDEATDPESMKLREIQENNLKFIMDERSEYIAEMQREMEEMLKEDQSTQLRSNHSFEIYLNDQETVWKELRSKIKMPSKMHVPDTSILSIEMPFDEGVTDSLAIQLQRVQSDSLVRQMSI